MGRNVISIRAALLFLLCDTTEAQSRREVAHERVLAELISRERHRARALTVVLINACDSVIISLTTEVSGLALWHGLCLDRKLSTQQSFYSKVPRVCTVAR